MIRSIVPNHNQPSQFSMGMLAGIPANEGMLNAIHSLRVPPVENNNVETMKRGSSPSPEESGEKRSEAHIETPSKKKQKETNRLLRRVLEETASGKPPVLSI